MIVLTFLEELMLIKLVHQKSVIFDTIDNFQINGLSFNFHDLLIMSINFNDVAILNINGADYCFNLYGISKSDAVKLLQNANLMRS